MIVSPVRLRKVRFVETPSPEPFWRVLHRLADAAYPRWLDALTTVLGQAGVGVSLHELQAAVGDGPPSLIATLLEDAWDADGAPGLRALFDAEAPSLLATSANATARTAEIAIAFEVTDPALVLAAEAYAAERVTAIASTTREAIRTAVSAALQTQQNVGQLARTLRGIVGLTPRQADSLVRYGAGLTADGVSPGQAQALIERQRLRLLRRRATTIARTETINTASAGQHLLWQQARTQGLISTELRRYWLVTPDDRLCFCAGTLVAIPGGQKPIEALRVGEYVITPKGKRQLLGTMVRPYAGILVIVYTSIDTLFIVTASHLIYTRRGWISAEDLHPGDILQALNDQPACVVAVIQFGIKNTQNGPPMPDKEGIASLVPFGVCMPIDPVDFDINFEPRDGKVERISSKDIFLYIRDMQSFEQLPDMFFGECLPSKPAVACHGAELSIDVSWAYPKLFSACSAHDIAWRSPTLLGAVGTRAISFSCESFLAAPACNLDGIFSSAGKRAYGIAVGNNGLDAKWLSTDGAYFLYRSRGNACVVAFSGTKAFLPFLFGGEDQKGLSALFTYSAKVLRSPSLDASMGTIDTFPSRTLLASDLCSTVIAIVGERHRDSLQKTIKEYNKYYSISVYDIQVEDAPMFYAEGVLVHNCPICSVIPGLNPDGVGLEELFQTPVGGVLYPAVHPNCRCAVSLSSERPEIPV